MFRYRRVAAVAAIFSVAIVLLPPRAKGGNRAQPESGPEGASRTQEAPDFTLRARRECGINGLYILLTLCEHPVDYRQLAAVVTVGPEGSSLLQLRDGARRLGIPTTVYKLTYPELVKSPKPILAHFGRSPFFARDDGSDYGHFVVVLSADNQRLSVLDGSFGAITHYTREKFEDRWTGHILAPDLLLGPRWERWAVGGTASFWAIIGLCFFQKSRAKAAAEVR